MHFMHGLYYDMRNTVHHCSIGLLECARGTGIRGFWSPNQGAGRQNNVTRINIRGKAGGKEKGKETREGAQKFSRNTIKGLSFNTFSFKVPLSNVGAPPRITFPLHCTLLYVLTTAGSGHHIVAPFKFHFSPSAARSQPRHFLTRLLTRVL